MPPGLLPPYSPCLPYSQYVAILTILTLLIPGAGGSVAATLQNLRADAAQACACRAQQCTHPARHSHYPRRTQALPGTQDRRTAGPQDRRAGLTRRSQEYRWAASNHCVGTATCTCDAWMPLSPPPALLLHPLALCHPLHVTRTVPPLPARPARPIAVPSTRPRLFTPTSSPHTLPPLTGGVWGRVGGTRGGARWRYWSQVLFALVCGATRVAEWPMCSVDFFVPCRLLCDSSTCQ
jgi:hypothetical protein